MYSTQGASHVNMKAEIRVMWLQAKECQRWPENHQKLEEGNGTDWTSQPSEGTSPADGLTSGLWIVTLRLDTLVNCNFLKCNQIFMASLHEISIYWPDSAEQQIFVKLMNNKGPCHEHCCQYLWETTASSPGPTRNRNIHCNTQERPRVILSWKPTSGACRPALTSFP